MAKISIGTARASYMLDFTSDQHQQRLQQSILSLEQSILSKFKDLEVGSKGDLIGPKVNLKQAQKVHADMVRIFDEEFGETTRQITNGYSEVDSLIQSTWQEFGASVDFTGVDKDMTDALRNTYYNEFLKLGEEAQERIASAMYSSIAAQGGYQALLDEVSAVLTGRFAKNGVPMAAYAGMMANDSIMNYHQTLGLKKAADAGLDHFLYCGNIMNTSRPFCIERVGRVYSREEINNWTFRWKGKAGPAMTHRGGYNCRHHWQPVDPKWMEGISEDEFVADNESYMLAMDELAKYGVKPGSKGAKFVEALIEKPMTNDEIKALSWNKAGNLHNDIFGRLKKQGLAGVDDQGRKWIRGPIAKDLADNKAAKVIERPPRATTAAAAEVAETSKRIKKAMEGDVFDNLIDAETVLESATQSEISDYARRKLGISMANLASDFGSDSARYQMYHTTKTINDEVFPKLPKSMVRKIRGVYKGGDRLSLEIHSELVRSDGRRVMGIHWDRGAEGLNPRLSTIQLSVKHRRLSTKQLKLPDGTYVDHYDRMRTLNIGYGDHNIAMGDWHAIVRHEYGHHVHQYLDKQSYKDWSKFFDDNAEYFSQNVSRYSATNHKEAFAEAFSAYTSPLYDKAAGYGTRYRLDKKIEEALEQVMRGERITAYRTAEVGTTAKPVIRRAASRSAAIKPPAVRLYKDPLPKTISESVSSKLADEVDALGAVYDVPQHRLDEMKQAIYSAGQGADHVFALRGIDKEIRAVMSIGDHGDALEIFHFGSFGTTSGAGTEAMRRALEYAKRKGLPLEWTSSDDAVGFYKKLGFKTVEGNAKAFKASLDEIDDVLARLGPSGKIRPMASEMVEEFVPRAGLKPDKDYYRIGDKWYKAGKEVVGEEAEKLAKMRIPPAWDNVLVSSDPAARVQAVGMDKAGRWQARYSAEHTAEAARKKFNRVKNFSRDMPSVRAQYEEAVAAGDPRAMLLRLEDQTAIRVGSLTDFKAKKKAYGLTTLENRHVAVDGNKITLNFVAKEGKDAVYELHDDVLAQWLRERKAMVGENDRLFYDVDASKLNAYLKELAGGKSYSIKDFRTYHGTRIAFDELKHYAGKTLTTKERKAVVKEVSEKVSQFLSNTPTMARNSYIDPMVWDFIGGLP